MASQDGAAHYSHPLSLITTKHSGQNIKATSWKWCVNSSLCNSNSKRNLVFFYRIREREAAELKGGQGKFPFPSFVLSQFWHKVGGGLNCRAVLQKLRQWAPKTPREMPFFLTRTLRKRALHTAECGGNPGEERAEEENPTILCMNQEHYQACRSAMHVSCRSKGFDNGTGIGSPIHRS